MSEETTTTPTNQESHAEADLSTSRLIRVFAAALLALAPFGYLSILLGVAIHEVIGHGLTSLAVGGDFLGFQIDFDGMGYALVPLTGSAETWRQVFILSGGVAATSILGLILLFGGYAFRRRPWIALPLIVLSFGILMDGIPYVFWNSIKPVSPGDLGKILAMVDGSWLRIILVLFGGASMIAAIWAFTALTFVVLQSWVTGGARLRGKARLVSLLLVGFIPGIAWFTFDWNQLIPGIGVVPNVAGFVLHMVASGWFLWFGLPPLPLRSRRGIVPAALIGWCLAAASIAAIAIWLREGINFVGY